MAPDIKPLAEKYFRGADRWPRLAHPPASWKLLGVLVIWGDPRPGSPAAEIRDVPRADLTTARRSWSAPLGPRRGGRAGHRLAERAGPCPSGWLSTPEAPSATSCSPTTRAFLAEQGATTPDKISKGLPGARVLTERSRLRQLSSRPTSSSTQPRAGDHHRHRRTALITTKGFRTLVFREGGEAAAVRLPPAVSGALFPPPPPDVRGPERMSSGARLSRRSRRPTSSASCGTRASASRRSRSRCGRSRTRRTRSDRLADRA
jgi:hypothetical protein